MIELMIVCHVIARLFVIVRRLKIFVYHSFTIYYSYSSCLQLLIECNFPQKLS